MAISVDDSFNPKVRDSFNTTNTTNSNNTANITPINVEGNTLNSESNNGNTDSSGSGNWSNNLSGNTVDSNNDNSSHVSDDHTNNSTNDSYNTLNLTSTDSHAISAGDRSYNTGFGGINGGEGVWGGGGGTLNIDARSTVVDQSVNQNIASGWGGVDTSSSSNAVVASGDGSLAAGGDINITNISDHSTNIDAGGDVNIGNTTTVSMTSDSYNTWTDNSQHTDNSVHASFDDSFNAYHTDVSVDHSFNSESNSLDLNQTDVHVNAIVDSAFSGIADGNDFHF